MIGPSIMLTIQNPNLDDLAAILDVQRQCYSEQFLESVESFHAKIIATPQTCWLAKQGDKALAYLITLPVCHDTFPTLNAPAYTRSTAPELLYIHDLAVAPGGRALGLGKQLVEQAVAAANMLDIPRLGLIAVQGSADYWTRYGFQTIDITRASLVAKIASFGNNARYMEMPATQKTVAP